jgi:Zn-dependent membrane protease YugP
MPNKNITVLFILMTLLLFVGCKDNRSCNYDPETETLECSEATYKTAQVNGKNLASRKLKLARG